MEFQRRRPVLDRVHLGDRRNESKVDAGRLGHFSVVHDHPGVVVQIFVGCELQRVDEDRHDRDVIVGSGPLEQTAVAIVERAHRRNEPDGAPSGPLQIQTRAQLVDFVH